LFVDDGVRRDGVGALAELAAGVRDGKRRVDGRFTSHGAATGAVGR
jgi:hypothetical protein